MVASESDYDRLRGEIGVGLFMTDWRIQQRVNEVEAERRDLSKAEVFLLVFWRETAWREETKARAAIVALEMAALRWREADYDRAMRAAGAGFGVHPMSAPLASWDGVSMVGFDTRPANAPTHLEAGKTFAWVSKVGADGSITNVCMSTVSPTERALENAKAWLILSGCMTPDELEGDGLEQLGLAFGVERNTARTTPETDEEYRKRIWGVIESEASKRERELLSR